MDICFERSHNKRTQDSKIMTRQFFVGGNFKLNPPSVTASQLIVDVLNKGDLDPETGACNLSIEDGNKSLTIRKIIEN